MQRLMKWLRKKRTLPAQIQAPLSVEWMALEKALLVHNFAVISPCLRAWCMLPERGFGRLNDLVVRAAFNSAEANKIEILFEHYSGNMEVAFNLAQAHMTEHGFDPDLHVISLACLYHNNQFEGAHAYQCSLSDADALKMDRPDYWQMVSVIRWATNAMDTLEQAVDRTIALAPHDSAVLQTALGMYIELGIPEKVALLKIQLAKRSDAQGYAYSLSLLALGDYEQGWLQMEARYDLEDAHRYINQGIKSKPRWQGQPLNGARLMLSAEQGLGDTIQMARYLPVLQSLGATQIFLETQPETLTLLQYNFPEIPMVERLWAQAPALGFDVWTGLMSLPHHLKAWGKATPGRSGYLRVPPENTLYWKERVKQLSPTQRPKIGLTWSGQPNHRADRRRSISFDLMMRQVRGLPVSFFALQTHVPQILPANVMNVSEEMITLADTAALIEHMDLVITVDTSVVHIAGALGKATWLLLPKRYEWRWGLEGEENDWYDSVKVVRQTEHANWAAVLQNVFEHRLPEQFNF